MDECLQSTGRQLGCPSLRCDPCWAWTRVTEELRESEMRFFFFTRYAAELVMIDRGGRLSLGMAGKLGLS